MPVKGKQIIDNTITQEKLNLDDPIANTDAATKNYVDNNRAVDIESVNNKNMTANDTAIAVEDFPLAVNTAVVDTPTTGTKVDVVVNGEIVRVGDGLDCYFSPDGTVIRASGEVEQGDFLYWNKLGAAYNLESTDIVDFYYMISVLSGA